MYYFGGACNHDQCRHNSLHELDTDDLKWTFCLPNTDDGPIKKSGCGMVAIHQDLLVVGGFGSSPKNPQPLAQYDEGGRTNEHHIHKLGTGELRSAMTCVVHVCDEDRTTLCNPHRMFLRIVWLSKYIH